MRLDLKTTARIRRAMGAETGSTATEYAILAAFVSVAIFATVALVGGSLNGVFITVNGMIGP